MASSRSRTHAPALGALFLLLAAGCAGGAGPPGSFLREDSTRRSIRIHVTNLNFMDATLWALTPGTRRKLGVVTGKRERVFDLPLPHPTDLSMEIDILTGPRCTTEALMVDPGDEIELVIDLEMVRSPLCVRVSPP